MSKQSLIPVESVNSLEVFTNGGLDKLLKRIESEVSGFVPDLETAGGRKEIASMAHKVSRSKVAIDKAGKELVADWKQKAKAVDESRRHARTFLDGLRDEVRRPLTEWEAEQERILEEKRRLRELARMQEEAYAEDVIWEREQEIKRREAEIAAQEEKRRREEEAKRQAEEQARREEEMRKEAEERAQREAEEKIRAEQEKAAQAERERKAAEDRAIREAEQAAERERQAKEQAEREKQEAIERERERAKEEAAERERERQRLEDERKREEERRAADRENRRKINNEIVAAFHAEGVGERTAQKIVRLVASGAVPNMAIRY